MKTVAIIAEYNPFHLGHAWQVQAIRRQFGQDCAVVAAMSGCFTQRGEPAILDKWNRTRMALSCGVDLVIELPFIYAAASAERFASGGVQLLQATGLDCQLAFGSESGDLDRLQVLAALLAEETPEFQQLLRAGLDEGESFPAARQAAVAAITGEDNLAALLEQSNNILAIEYLKAIYKIPHCRLKPVTFQRQGQDYNDRRPETSAGFASASAIRQALAEHLADPHPDLGQLVNKLMPMMPASSLAILMEQIQTGQAVVTLDHLAAPIIGLLRSRAANEIEKVPGMSEGLGRRLASIAARPAAAPGAGRLASLLESAGTRRFPQTRIQRALISLLADVRPEDLSQADHSGGPQYIRVLGFNKKGRYLLKVMRRIAERPIIMKASDFLEYNDPMFCRMAELDLLSTDLWMLSAGRQCGADFDTPVVMG